MNIRPVAHGTGQPAGSDIGNGRSASASRIARATAVAQGQQPNPPQQEQELQAPVGNRLKIKMRTQRSIYRDIPAQTETEELPPESNIPTLSETPATAETKPLSPQFAALAKQKRAIQQREMALAEREKALEAKEKTPVPTGHVSIDDLKADPLAKLLESGVTYEQLTESVLARQQDPNVAYSELSKEIQGLKEAVKNQNTNLENQAVEQRKQAVAQMTRDAQSIVNQGDEFQMVRETGSVKKAIELIERAFDEHGELLDVQEALGLIEKELLDQSLRFAKISKVQSQLGMAPEQTQTQQIQNSNVRPMRTLTNRSGASAPLSARERAINAFYGRK